MVIEGINASGREYPGLAHAATEHLAPPPRRTDQLGRPREHRTNRRAQALRKTHRDAVERFGNGGRFYAEGNRRVPNASTVEVQRQTMLIDQRASVGTVGLRQDLSVDRVFESEQSGARKVRVVDLDLGCDHIEVQGAVRRELDRLWLNASKNSRTASFVLIGVRCLAHDVLLAASTMSQQCTQV